MAPELTSLQGNAGNYFFRGDDVGSALLMQNTVFRRARRFHRRVCLFVPNGVPYINVEDIARQLHERLGEINVQGLSNAQALERMNGFMALRQSFAVETNLADHETWQFLMVK
jgi:hypothetical protein